MGGITSLRQLLVGVPSFMLSLVKEICSLFSARGAGNKKMGFFAIEQKKVFLKGSFSNDYPEEAHLKAGVYTCWRRWGAVATIAKAPSSHPSGSESGCVD